MKDIMLKLIWRACEQTGRELTPPNNPVADAAAIASPRLPVHFATIVKLLILKLLASLTPLTV